MGQVFWKNHYLFSTTLSASRQQLILSSPLIAIVEAKNENIIGGLGQCIAEMVAASIFNQAENNQNITMLYGIVTTGTAWKFLKMNNLEVVIDLDEYLIENPGRILGILLEMLAQNAWVVSIEWYQTIPYHY